MKKKYIHHINFKTTNIRIFNLRILLIVVLFLMNLSNSFSIDYPSSRGKDFWLCYLPNFHNNAYAGDIKQKNGDSLYIFITSDVPTSGLITYYDINNNEFTQNFTITDTKKMYIFKVCHWGFELEGYNASGDITPGQNHYCEKVSPQSFHVESNDDITVYAHSQANTTSDAFLVLPTDAIGRVYYVMSYNSDGKTDSFGLNDSSTPSQFAIVATEDNTSVTIKPRAETRVNGLKTQNIKLDKGEVYLVQANITDFNLRGDLTGTEVIADKNISVFGGQQRSKIPVATNYTSPSRDILIEQIPSVSTWGKSAYLVPYIQSQDATNKGYDLFRIMAAFDSTKIFIDSSFVRYLNKGEFHEGILTKASEVTASSSILVAQFKKTAQDGTGAYPNSDPFMMIIPPKEQFLNSYRFINVQSYEYRSPFFEKVYNQQYVTVVAPDSIIKTIKLDGNLVPSLNFIKIGNTKYSFSHIVTSDGVHELSGSGFFGIMVYGYGQANSYGYIGGMSFKPLDFEKPKITSVDSCFKVFGSIHDSSSTDSHLDVVIIEQGSEDNVTAKLYPKSSNPSLVKFEGNLINKNLDGKFRITAKDSAGLVNSTDIWIPGFTVAFKNLINKDSLIVFEKIVKINRDSKFNFSLLNYGRFNQKLTSIKTKNNNIKIINSFPVSIQPSNSFTFEATANSPVDTVLYDTLTIANDCYEKQVVAVKIIVKDDKDKPKIYTVSDPCQTNFNITLTDSLEWDYGIENIEILDSINCKIVIDKYDPLLSKITINVINPNFDTFYSIQSIDSLGNKSIISDSIPGFTIAYDLKLDDNNYNYYNFGGNQLANRLCKTFKLTNFGNYDIVFDNAQLFQNVEFSFPQSQFPLKVKSKESVDVSACFYPLKVKKDQNRDTLRLFFKCLTKDIILIGNSDSLILNGDSKCEVNMKLYTTQVPFDYFIDGVFPNPAFNVININIGLPEESSLQFGIYNSQGQLLNNYENSMKLFSGIYELSINVENLENGLYFLKFNLGKITKFQKLIISK
jgi:hypothetical protein